MKPQGKYATSTSYRLSDEAKKIISVTAAKLGISRTAALEVIIRHYRDCKGKKPE